MSLDRSAYIRAIVDLLADEGLRVRSGVAPEGTTGQLPTPYVVVFLAPADPFGESVGCQCDDGVVTFSAVSVDLTDQGAAALDDRVRSALMGATVAVEGRVSHPIRWSRSGGVERDDDDTPPVYYVSSLFTLVSAASSDEES